MVIDSKRGLHQLIKFKNNLFTQIVTEILHKRFLKNLATLAEWKVKLLHPIIFFRCYKKFKDKEYGNH